MDGFLSALTSFARSVPLSSLAFAVAGRSEVGQRAARTARRRSPAAPLPCRGFWQGRLLTPGGPRRLAPTCALSPLPRSTLLALLALVVAIAPARRARGCRGASVRSRSRRSPRRSLTRRSRRRRPAFQWLMRQTRTPWAASRRAATCPRRRWRCSMSSIAWANAQPTALTISPHARPRSRPPRRPGYAAVHLPGLGPGPPRRRSDDADEPAVLLRGRPSAST